MTDPSVLTMLMLTVSLCFVAVVILRRRSLLAYAAVAADVILSMLMTPLLGARRVVAFAAVQEEKSAFQEEQRAQQGARPALPEAMAAASVNPHADPLAVAHAAAVAAPVTQNEPDSRYLDPSCESDPTGDIDGDGLTNPSECLVGTLPDVADTDTDGLTDLVEATGFTDNNQTWYTDPLNIDSNYDSIGDGKEWRLDADDTDGDGTPDIWDDDNDGDSVRDDQDLSPCATTKDQGAFSDAQPFELTIDGLIESELIRVEFQIRPTDADHLWLPRACWIGPRAISRPRSRIRTA